MEQYNQFKTRFATSGEERYRAEKSRFIAAVLAQKELPIPSDSTAATLSTQRVLTARPAQVFAAFQQPELQAR